MDPLPTDHHQVLLKDRIYDLQVQVLTSQVPVVPSEVLLRGPAQVHGVRLKPRELHEPPVEEEAINIY